MLEISARRAQTSRWETPIRISNSQSSKASKDSFNALFKARNSVSESLKNGSARSGLDEFH